MYTGMMVGAVGRGIHSVVVGRSVVQRDALRTAVWHSCLVRELVVETLRLPIFYGSIAGVSQSLCESCSP